MRAIPAVPLDGEQYVGPWLGVPAVLEFDAPTGGYKLVVTTETGVAINISGTVEITGGEVTAIGGAQYGEDTPHGSGQTGTFVMAVRQDAATSLVDTEGDYSPFIVDQLGRLHTFVSGSYTNVLELTAAATLGASFASPISTQIGAFLYGFDSFDSNVWERLDSGENAGDAEATITNGILKVNSYLMAVNAQSLGAGRWDRLRAEGVTGSYALRTSLYAQQDIGNVNPAAPGNFALRVDPQGRLITSAYVTGTVTAVLETDLQIGAVEIKNADSDLRAVVNVLTDAMTQPTGTLAVGAYGMVYDIVGDNWDRDPARVYANAMASPVAPQRIAFGMHFDYTLGSNHPNYGARPDADGISGDSGGGAAEHGQNVNAILFARDGGAGSVFDRLVGPVERGLYVSMISGSFPGQSSAIVIDDTVPGSLRAGLVGAANLMYDTVGGNWERDPARLPGDAMAQGVFPQRVSFGVQFNYAAGAWERQYGGDVSADNIGGGAGGADLDNSQNVRSVLLLNRGNFQYDTAYGRAESGMNVSLISGSFPGQATAQLLGDAIVNPYAGIVGGANLMYDVAGDNWERDPARNLADGMAGAVFPQRISFGMAYNYSTTTHSRVRSFHPSDGVFMTADTEFGPSLATAALLYATTPAGTTADRLRMDSERRLLVNALVTGTVTAVLQTDIQIGAVEIKNADSDLRAVVNVLTDAMTQPTGTLAVGAYNMVYDVVGDNWDRREARLWNENMSAPVAPAVNAFGMHFNYAVGLARRNRGGHPGDNELMSADSPFSDALNVKAIMYGVDSAGNADRIRGSQELGLNVNMISGSFPHQSTLVLADAMTNPTPLLVGSHLLGYNGVSWDRLYMGQSGSLAVDLVTALDAATDEVTAYVTGSVSVTGQTFDAEGRLNTRAFVTGSIDLNVGDIQIGAVEIKNADSDLRAVVNVLSDALTQPTGTLAVGAYNLIYDIVGDNWDRDPARLVADGMAAGVFPQRISHSMFFDYVAGTMDRLRGGDTNADSLAPTTNFGNAINVRSAIYGLDSGGSWSRIRGNQDRGLYTSMISGSFPGQDGSYLVSDTVGQDQLVYAGLIASLGMAYRAQDVGSVTGSWTRLLSDPITGALLVSVTGTASVDTELPTALVLADAMANPTVPGVGAHLMGYNGVTWDRLYMGVSGSLSVDLVSQLDAVNDEVTAYVTGTLSVAQDSVTFATADGINASQQMPRDNAGNALWTPTLGYYYNGASWDRIRGRAVEGAFVNMISGSFPAGSNLIPADGMATPLTTLGVTSHLMGYNGATWDRLGINSNDELQVEANLPTGSVIGIAGQTKVIRRAVINISGSGGEFELVAAVASERIKVLSMMLVGDADTSIFFQSGWTGTAVTGPMSLPADGDGFFLNTPSTSDQFHFESEPGENLVLDSSQVAALGGWIQYYTEV